MIVFWDIDDTIYDRCDAFSSACDRFLNTPAMKKRAASAGDEAHFPLPDGRIIYRFCDKRGDEVFKASQTGEISMEEMYVYRYCKGFADAGIRISPDEALLFQNIYEEQQKQISCTETMRSALRLSSERAEKTGILTNGPSGKQRGKIASLGIAPFLTEDLVLISGELGTDKPEKEIFLLAQERSGVPAKELLLIGDSLKNDIIPASAMGWNTVWFNRHHASAAGTGTIADETVDTEEELLQALFRILKPAVTL